MQHRISPAIFAACFFSPAVAVADGVTISLRDANVTRITAVGGPGPVVLAGRLIVRNEGTAAFTWDWSDVSLRSGAVSRPFGPTTEGGRPLRIGRRTVQTAGIPRSGPASVPAGETGEFDAVFFDVPASNGVRDLEIVFGSGGEDVAVRYDISAAAAEKLQLATRRIGPGRSAAVVEVGGFLDVFSAAVLIGEFDRLLDAGVERVVVSTGREAIDTASRRWLLGAARSFSGSPLNADLYPTLPAGLKGFEVHGLGHAGGSISGGSGEDSLEAAVSRLLEPALRDVDAATLRGLVAGADPLTLVAVLDAGGRRLGDVDTLVALTGDQSGPVALAATRALRQYGDPEAVGTLVRLASGESRTLAEAALTALVSSRHRSSWAGVKGLYETADAETRGRILAAMARQPRAAWRELVVAAAEGREPGDRVAAIRALAEIGHPRLVDIIGDALSAPETASAAADLLLDRLDDPRGRRLAVSVAEDRLGDGIVDTFVKRVAVASGDPRLTEALIAAVDSAPAGRRLELLRLSADVGGSAAADHIRDLWDGLTTKERAVALSAFGRLDAADIAGPVEDALGSDDAILVRQAIGLLETRGDEDAVGRLVEILNKASRPNTVSEAAAALAAIGTTAAADALIAAAQVPDEMRREAAVRHYRGGSWPRSAAAAAIDAAEAAQRAENWAGAVPLWDKVITIDPLLASAHTSRGHALVRCGRAEEAGAAYLRAYELDPTDANAVTGVAIAAAGRPDGVAEAVAFVERHVERLRFDNIFLYNVACVYGVALQSSSTDAGGSPVLSDRLKSSAIDYLRRSVELGFDQAEWAKEDPDLAALRDEPAFIELFAGIAAEEPAEAPAD
ncbi:MAG: HEAT repeat domain-containing protein [Planctomycetota bacterium]